MDDPGRHPMEFEDAGPPPRRQERTYLQRPYAEQDRGLDAEAIQGFLWRWKWTILEATVGVFGLVAIVTLFLLPVRYESSASFLVERQDRAAGSEALSVLEGLGRIRNTETEVELLQERRVLESAVDTLNLHVWFGAEGNESARAASVFPAIEASREAEPGTYWLAHSEEGYRVTDQETGTELDRARPGGHLEFAGISLALPDDGSAGENPIRVLPFAEAVEWAEERITAAPAQREADLVRLRCQGSSPESARDLCRAVQDSYMALRSELQRAEASAAARFLDDQVERIQERLVAAEDTLQEYRESNQAVALEQQANESVAQYARIQARHGELTAERNAIASLIDTIEASGGGLARYRRLASFPTFLQNQGHIVSSLVGSLVQLENRRSDLAVRRTPEDPEMRALDVRIGEIERQLLDIAQSYRQSVDAQIRSLEQTIRDQSRQLATIPERQVESARLERRVTMLEDLYEFLQTRHQEAEVAEAVTLPSVRIVGRPSLPTEPSSPNVPLNLALGAVLGLGTGLLGGLWREYTDEKIRDREGVEATGIPVLTMVPRVQRGLVLGDGRGNGEESLRSRFLPAAMGGSGPREEAEVARESFRTLSFELEAAAEELGEDVDSVAITSAGRGDGKTFCATNLAGQSARMGKRTLLVDGDLRAQGVGRLLDLPSRRVGLGNILRGYQDPFAAAVEVEIGDGVRLDVLPSGSSRTNHLPTDRLRAYIRSVTGQYDLVVVDTPPLNILSDAAQIATSVDGVLVVVRAGVTKRPGLQLTLERLERTGGRVLGLVLNEVRLPGYYTNYGVQEGG